MFWIGLAAGIASAAAICAAWMHATVKYYRNRLEDDKADALIRENIAFNEGKKDAYARFGRPEDYHH